MIAEVWRFAFSYKRPLQGKLSAIPINAIYCHALLLNRRAYTLDSYRFIRKQKYFNKFRQLRAVE